MSISSWHPSRRERNQTARILFFTGVAACAVVSALSIRLFFIPAGAMVRDMGGAILDCGVALISFAVAVCLFGPAWRSSRRALAVAGLIFCLAPFPLAAALLQLASRLTGFIIED